MPGGWLEQGEERGHTGERVRAEMGMRNKDPVFEIREFWAQWKAIQAFSVWKDIKRVMHLG